VTSNRNSKRLGLILSTRLIAWLFREIEPALERGLGGL
jgi:hypothetical protein